MATIIKIVYNVTNPVIKVTYDVTNITIGGAEIAPVYISLDYSSSSAVTVITSVGLTMPTGFSVANSPLTQSGTLAVSYAAGYSLPTITKQSEWDQAYNDKINSAAVTGTTTKTLTLNQQDGGTVTASWSDIDTGTVTSVDMTVPTGLLVSGNPITSAGTLALTYATGYSIPLNTSQANWDSAYNDKINSASVTGTTTKTLTLNQQDGGTVTASWTDDNTDAVTSVFGRIGAVVATEGDYNLNQLGDVTLTSPTNGQVLKYNGTTWINNTDTDTGLTSVGLTMPSAFNVANSPLTSNGTLAVTGAGLATQYIRGDGQLATFPSTAGGGSSVNYYLNGSINASVGGYKQMDNNAIIGGGTDFTLSGNGLIAQFLTDVGNPNRLLIPGGAWNFEMYFNSSSNGGNEGFYVELHKYNGSTFTLIASSSTSPESITSGTSIDLYLTSLAVPTTTLLATDRLAIRVYIVNNAAARTITFHTENNTLCEIITTFAGGVASLNGLTANTQYFATGVIGTDFNISSVSDTHTFNIPTSSGSNRGLLSPSDWTMFNNKENVLTFSAPLERLVNTISIDPADHITPGYLKSQDWVTFNAKVSSVSATNPLFSTGGSTPTLTIQQGSGSQSGYISSTDWLTFNAKQAALNGTGIVKSVAGTISYLTDNSGDWNTSYNNMIVSAAVTGTTTKTLTLTQQDTGTITATWTDDNTDAVSSVFGRTGAVIAVSGDYNTSQVTESGNLYYTDARVSANTDVAANTAARHNAVTIGTANGLSLSTQALSLALSSISTTGALSSTDWSTFNAKQNAITLTTTGSSGSATFIANTLNIPSYSVAGLGAVPESRTITINGEVFDLSANRSFEVGDYGIF